MADIQRVVHNIPPIFDEYSNILILGSFPSLKSRETAFFYGHPQNRFWIVTSKVFKCELPQTIDEKKAFLKKNRIALWDVIASCDISGSADNTITNVIPNDISVIFSACSIKQIYVNGKTAYALYKKHIDNNAICLPSTSPANAAWNLEKLINSWRIIAV